jgi:hypothetical protein
MNQQGKKKRSKNVEPYHFSDEATRKKIKRHLADIKDVITEKDIANVKVPGTENDPVVPSEKETTRDNPESPRDKTVTPWDTLEE